MTTNIQGDQFILVLCKPNGNFISHQGKITGSDFTNIVIAYGKICLQKGFGIYRAGTPCGYYKNQKGERLPHGEDRNVFA